MTRIIHVVLWKLAPPPAGVDALVHKQQVTSGFAKLLKVPGPISGHLGEPKIADRTKGFDYGFYSVFESMETLKKYAVSDEHMKVVIEDIRPNTVDVMAYDFEIDA